MLICKKWCETNKQIVLITFVNILNVLIVIGWDISCVQNVLQIRSDDQRCARRESQERSSMGRYGSVMMCYVVVEIKIGMTKEM